MNARIGILAVALFGALVGALAAPVMLRHPQPSADTKPKPVVLPKRAITFAQDVAPIVFDHCSSCHHQGEVAPFPLMSYADVSKRADLILQVTHNRVMPPWQPGPSDCKLDDDISLSPTQLALLDAWVKGGKLKGSSNPKPPTYTTGWKLGKPDLVATMPKAFNVPADGPDVYRNFVVPIHLDHDVWVKTVDFHPGNRAVVHHCLFFYDSSGNARKLDGEGGQPGFEGTMPTRALGGPRNILALLGGGESTTKLPFGGLGGWAVGSQPVPMPADYAFFLPAGSDLIFSTHFHPSGKPESEVSSIGLYFAKEPPSHGFMGMLLPVLFGATAGINIAPGAKNFAIEDEFTVPVATTLFTVGAHAHYLGKTFDLRAEFPDGTKKVLFTVPNWDFNWQGRYNFAPFVRLPAGTKLVSKITYDNSSDNPRNPSNPPKWVTFGEQTTNEMGSVVLGASADSDADLQTLRKAYAQHVRQSFTGRRRTASRPGPVRRLLGFLSQRHQ
jgi:hypothetical protein